MANWRALVVTAHPDDMEFGAAGTLAKWAAQGAEITLCIGTDGSTGTQDRSLMGAPLHEIRIKESQRAADLVGIKELIWLGLRDGYVEYTLDLRREIARLFRRYRPHRFMVMDPTPTIDLFINHPDHRAIGQASLDVSMTAGTTPGHFPELLEEGLDPWRGLREVWIAGPGLKPRVVDITDTIDTKIEALRCHQSQVGENADEIAEFVRQYCAEAGKPAGFDYAESFQVISQGPGFHAGEQEDDVDLSELATAPLDARSTAPAPEH
ncbi:MAG TPA: PIG-L deacetylase family protein [Actinomycetota bacterium]|nr:PIG-L deacetylase family protein [Actinomycetota bacterium]